MNQTIKRGIARTNQFNWDLQLLIVLYAIRTTRQASTKQTPFYLVYGIEDDHAGMSTPEERIAKELAKLNAARELAKEEIIKSQERQKKYYDTKVKPQELQIGDLVLVYRSMI